MSSYAIIQSGGKQYRVKSGDIIDVELIEREEGKAVAFNEVLFLNTGSEVKIGSPVIAKAQVKGEILQEVRGPKVLSYKYKKRKNYRRKVGHRQDYLRVKITELVY